jgi:hypothetical protein
MCGLSVVAALSNALATGLRYNTFSKQRDGNSVQIIEITHTNMNTHNRSYGRIQRSTARYFSKHAGDHLHALYTWHRSAAVDAAAAAVILRAILIVLINFAALLWETRGDASRSGIAFCLLSGRS